MKVESQSEHRTPQEHGNPATGSRSTTNRNIAIDNAKGLMLVFVIFGHLLEPFIDSHDTLRSAYRVIYSFHMPVFVIVSGMFSKNTTKVGHLFRSGASLLIPFIVFSLLYELFHLSINGNISNYGINLQPYWILWFLYSLFCWRLLLPIFSKFRHPLLLSFVVSLSAGYFESIGYSLGISRVIYFLPLFLIGHKISTRLNPQKTPKIPAKAALIAILLTNFVILWKSENLSHDLFFGAFSYHNPDLAFQNIKPVLCRILIYTISTTTALSLIAISSDRKSWLTRYGSQSLYVYVWHGFFIMTFSALGLPRILDSLPTELLAVGLATLSLLLAQLLATETLEKATNKLLLSPFRNFFSNLTKRIKIT